MLENATPSLGWNSRVGWTEAGLLLLITGFIVNASIFLTRAYNFAFGFVPGTIGILFMVIGGSGKIFGPRQFGYSLSSLAIWTVTALIPGVPFLGLGRYVFVWMTLEGSIGLVLLTYELQDVIGRILLWTAFTVDLAWSVTLVTVAYSNPSYLPVIWQIILTLTPGSIFSFAFLWAFYRILKKRIPRPVTIFQPYLQGWKETGVSNDGTAPG